MKFTENFNEYRIFVRKKLEGDVISLNIDSASFTQIEEACNKDVEKIGQMILDIVNERGKMQRSQYARES